MQTEMRLKLPQYPLFCLALTVRTEPFGMLGKLYKDSYLLTTFPVYYNTIVDHQE